MSVVYFIRFEYLGRWKIGFSSNCAESRTQTATFTPCKFWIEAEINGDQALEQSIHRRFSRQRVRLPGRSEIFETSPELERFVAYAKAFGTVVGFDEYKKGDLRIAARALLSPEIPEAKPSSGVTVQQLRKEARAFALGTLGGRIVAAWQRANDALEVDSLDTNYFIHVSGGESRFYVDRAFWGKPSARQVPAGTDECGRLVYRREYFLAPCGEQVKGYEQGLLFLSGQETAEQCAIAWVFLAAKGLLSGRSRDYPGLYEIECLELIREVAEKHVNIDRSDLHHACTRFFPEQVERFLVDDERRIQPTSLEAFTSFVAVMRAKLLGRAHPVIVYYDGAYQESHDGPVLDGRHRNRSVEAA
jgi:hypothetical protein